MKLINIRMEKYAMKVIESRDVQVEVPLDVRDIKNILNNEPQRLVKRYKIISIIFNNSIQKGCQLISLTQDRN